MSRLEHAISQLVADISYRKQLICYYKIQIDRALELKNPPYAWIEVIELELGYIHSCENAIKLLKGTKP